MSTRGSVIFAYLFGVKFEKVPYLDEVIHFKPNDAARKIRTGYLGLINNEWPILGEMPNWSDEDWPMPIFVRKEGLTDRIYYVQRDDNEPAHTLTEWLTTADINGVEQDISYGYGAVEMMLTKLLTDKKALL